MSMRKLASIKRLDAILPIMDADAIELAIIGGWQAVVKKGEFTAGDLVIYCEADSMMPLREEYEFLRKSSYRKMWDGTEGFRLRTIRLRGQLSQGLVLPLEVAIKAEQDSADEAFNLLDYGEGADVTELLGIVKWDTPPPGVYQGQGKGGLPMNALGYFPDWLPKTDEERIQNCWNTLPKEIEYVETEKLHGTSATYFLKDGVFGICSRNLNLKPEEAGLYGEIANELRIEEKMREYCKTFLAPEHGFAIQGEIIGEGINSNYNHIERRQLFIFNVFNEASSGYLEHKDAVIVATQLDLQYVPVINEHYKLPATCAQTLLDVEGPSTVGKQPVREGSVIRHSLPYGRRISAKIVSNAYLLKEK